MLTAQGHPRTNQYGHKSVHIQLYPSQIYKPSLSTKGKYNKRPKRCTPLSSNRKTYISRAGANRFIRHHSVTHRGGGDYDYIDHNGVDGGGMRQRKLQLSKMTRNTANRVSQTRKCWERPDDSIHSWTCTEERLRYLAKIKSFCLVSLSWHAKLSLFVHLVLSTDTKKCLTITARMMMWLSSDFPF